MMQSLTHYLIYLLLFSLPWQTHLLLARVPLNGQPWEFGSISLFAVDILIIIILVLHICTHRGLDLRFKRIPYRYLLVLFLILLFALIPTSLSPLISIAKTVYLCIAVLLVYILEREPVPFKNAANAFVLGAAVSGLLGIWQFVSQSSFASSWLGLAEHDPSVLGVSVIEAIAPDGMLERWLRAYGSLDHPNMFGGFMAVALIFASWLWLKRDSVRTGLLSVVTILATIILTGSLLLSFSRGAWIAAFVGLIIISFSYLRHSEGRLKEFVAWAASIIFVIIIIASQYGYLFAPRLSGDSRLENLSIVERTAGLRDSLSLISAEPFFGHGAGTYALALAEKLPGKQVWFYQPAHNVFALITTEIGVVGLLLFLASLITFLIHVYKKRKNDSTALILAITTAVFIISLFDHWPYSLHFGVICSGALIGLLANASRADTLTDERADG